MKRVWLAAALTAAFGISCNDPDNLPVTLLNFDRPIDVAFACYGGLRLTGGGRMGTVDDPLTTSAQPVASCDVRSPQLTTDPHDPPQGQEVLSGQTLAAPAWYAFILQSAAGTVAVATFASVPAQSIDTASVTVLDTDPLTPGNNAVSVGEDPVALVTDTSGCYEVTANAGSCDLSVLDINSVLDDIPNPPAGMAATPVRLERRQVRNAAGRLMLARPSAMVVQPSKVAIGNTCPKTASGLVYVTYPRCHLVAGVDTETGVIRSAIKYDAAGVPSILAGAALDGLQCADECTRPAMEGTGMPPVSLVDDRAPRPVTLSLQNDTRVNTVRLAVGAENLPSITMVELSTTDASPQTVSSIALTDTGAAPGGLGVLQVALSPQIGTGGDTSVEGKRKVTDSVPDDTRGGQAQYVYAVATDSSVRVVDVLDKKRECETQVDSRYARTISTVPDNQCVLIGALPRRLGARTPGVELPRTAKPVSVAIVHGLYGPVPDTSDGAAVDAIITPTVNTLIGYFAIVTASDGKSYVVNIDDDHAPDVYAAASMDSLRTAPNIVMAHQLRDQVTFRGARPGDDGSTVPPPISCLDNDPTAALGSALGGGPRSVGLPATSAPTDALASVKRVELPILRQVQCMGTDATNGTSVSELSFGATVAVRDEAWPDVRNTTNESWYLTWEGLLSADSTSTRPVDGVLVRAGQMAVDPSGIFVNDPARPFCDMGVEPYDIVQLRGCDPSNKDGDCPIGYSCFVHEDSKIALGQCMLASEASRLATACRDFLISQRRYTVSRADPGKLTLMPRRHELSTTPIKGCDSDAQCEDLADLAARMVSSADPQALVDVKDPHTWACRADGQRAPVETGKRCVEVCTSDADCDAGSLCQSGVCMEGIVPPQACINGPQRYDVRASEAFSVIGTTSGFIHPIVEQNNTCVNTRQSAPITATSLIQTARVPLQAPPCGPATTNKYTGQLEGGGFEPNPCQETVTQIETRPNYVPGTCTLDTNTPGILTQRETTAIKFRNRSMTFRLVDPTYPGDAACTLDRQGPYADAGIPLVVSGYRITITERGGFTPLTLPSVGPAYAVKVVIGPSSSIWVLDDGDYLSTLLGTPSTRGKVYRSEAQELTRVNTLQ